MVTASAPDVSSVRVLKVSRDINVDHKPSGQLHHSAEPIVGTTGKNDREEPPSRPPVKNGVEEAVCDVAWIKA
jgi:hypothetical protein